MLRTPSTLSVLICAGALPIAAGELPEPLISFLDSHCVECHDAEVSKGDLNLLDLAFEPGKPDNFKVWQRVVERVESGEMPPEKKPRPDHDKSEAFLAGLREPLIATDRADILEKGRVHTRRLTRLEYQHSLHDLLGIDIPLTGLLPEDPLSNGFETVASGQQLSYHQLSRYLDVADLALGEAFRRVLEGDESYHQFITPADLQKNGSGNYRGPDLRDGKSISWPLRLQFFGRMRPTAVPESGWYRITLKGVEAINPDRGGTVWGTLRSGKGESDAPLLFMIGLVEATTKPRDMVFEAWMEKGHLLELKPNDAELKVPGSGASGGNVSFKGRNLEKEGYSGIANRGIEIERIYPIADRATVRRPIFGEKPKDGSEWDADPIAAVEQNISRFARRAFRCPQTPEKIEPYTSLARATLKEGGSVPDALKTAYRAILCSPRFLTLVEAPGELDDFAIAARLSYALWVSSPDWNLLQLAYEGKLRKPEVLSAEISRLLAHQKAERFVESFTDQWLNLKQIDFTAPDPRQFKSFDPVLQESFLLETRGYFADLIHNDRSISNLVDSDHVFVNGRLARHYDLELPVKPGGGVQRVSLPAQSNSVRGGLVTQGAILKVTADGTHTSPVVRGVFVNERILGVHIPPPPPGIPAIEPDIRGATSIRDQLEKHRDSETCASCHQTIDPPGFALENFNPIGGWRTNYGEGGKGVIIDATGRTPDGIGFDKIDSWKSIYRDRKEDLARGFVRQFLTYATGSSPRFSDQAHLDAIVAQAEANDYGFRSLIVAALSSPIFLEK